MYTHYLASLVTSELEPGACHAIRTIGPLVTKRKFPEHLTWSSVTT